MYVFKEYFGWPSSNENWYPYAYFKYQNLTGLIKEAKILHMSFQIFKKKLDMKDNIGDKEYNSISV